MKKYSRRVFMEKFTIVIEDSYNIHTKHYEFSQQIFEGY
jgi:hypothetical protein